MNEHPSPPRLARLLLRLAVPQDAREFVAGDLEEEFLARSSTEGPRAARRFFWRETLRSLAMRFRHPPPTPSPTPRKGDSLMTGLAADLRYGARMLWKTRAVTFVAVLTLALGVGANTAIFSVVHGVLLKPLPYSQSENIVIFTQSAPSTGYNRLGLSDGQFLSLREKNESFDRIGVYGFRRLFLSNAGETERILAGLLSSGLLDVMRIQPALGRSFTLDDETPAAEAVVLLSHAYWRDRLAGRPDVLGHILHINNAPYTVVGVLPADFHLPAQLQGVDAPQIFLPTPFNPARVNWGSYSLFNVLARLKPGVTPQHAHTETLLRFQQLQKDHEGGILRDPGYALRVTPLHADMVSGVNTALWILLGAVVLVQLIACSNVASIFLARAAARRKEMAVRAALGADRGRLTRQLLLESSLLSFIAGAAGIALAWGGLQLLLRLTPGNIPRLAEISLSPAVLLFTLGLSALSTFLFGLIPAIQVARVDLNDSLREEGRGFVGGLGRSRMRSVLVVSEVALAVVLVVGAGLLLRSFDNLTRLSPGFNPENLVMLRYTLPPSPDLTDTRVSAFHRDLLDRVRTLPGVVSAAAVNTPPMLGFAGDTAFDVEGQPTVLEQMQSGSSNVLQHIGYRQISAEYLETLGVPLLAGRPIQESDQSGAPLVCVINQTMARTFFPGRDPIGQRIRLYRRIDQTGPWMQIVGITGDTRINSLNEDAKGEAFISQAQGMEIAGFNANPNALVVRAASAPAPVLAAMRSEIRAMDRNIPIFQDGPLDAVLSQSVAQPRFQSFLIGIFAAVALILSAVGLYGLMSYLVRQRTHEVGIRVALGAQRSDIFRLVVGRGMLLAAAGIAIGIAGALFATRLLRQLLFRVEPSDPLTFVGVTLLVAVIALLACGLPARRATSVDPSVALRYE